MSGVSTIAGIIAGYKSGQITEEVAKRALRQLGCGNDTAALLGLGAGIVGGMVLGDVIGDAVSDIFESLF